MLSINSVKAQSTTNQTFQGGIFRKRINLIEDLMDLIEKKGADLALREYRPLGRKVGKFSEYEIRDILLIAMSRISDKRHTLFDKFDKTSFFSHFKKF